MRLLGCILAAAAVGCADYAACQSGTASVVAFENGVPTWTIGPSAIRGQFGTNLTVASDPVSHDKSLGFTHFGYSRPDPTGKGGTLTVQFDVAKSDLGAGDASIDGVLGSSYILDVQLADDRNEENRIRKEVGLPRTLYVGSAVLLQVSWRGVPGRTLYSWLTAANGLRFVARSPAKVTLRYSSRSTVDRQAFDAWWRAKFGNATTGEFLGSGQAIVLDAFRSGAIKLEIVPSGLVYELLQFGRLNAMATCVEAHAAGAPSSQPLMVPLQEVSRCFEDKVDSALVANTIWSSAMSMGKQLTDEYVIDATSMKAGLAVLLDDGS